ILVKGWRIVIPECACGLITGVLVRPQWIVRRLVDVKHLASILGDMAGEHLPRAYCTTTMWIVLVAHRLHLGNVSFRDPVIPALIKNDAGIVAVIDDGIAHQFNPQFPMTAVGVPLCIAGRHGFDEADSV